MRCCARRSFTLAAATVIAALAQVACAPPSYEVVTHASVNPITDRIPITIRPPRVGEVLVDGKPESKIVMNGAPLSERKAWVDLLVAVRAAMLDGLAEHRGTLSMVDHGPGPAVELELVQIDLAHQNPRSAPKTVLVAAMRVMDKQGAVVEEVRFRSVTEATVVTEDELEETRTRRFKRAGEDIGRQAAEYLVARARDR